MVLVVDCTSDSRSRLKPERLEALVCGQDWIRHDEGPNNPEEKEEDDDEVKLVD
ncbi:hypothetical protein PGTUg99_021939 [Puccinia graminis f. sp. tritici]|uniref:HAT C-terminal dimerisation domain-containing protein n=1 Tax=Puccinia graminis f. sp. tritici TaxID=56615 RepID=A0A5B0SMI2_PUCGR|nr:hypothetical protein PGTUg99_021939 [Puccinia graminis f. sp. tritici]